VFRPPRYENCVRCAKYVEQSRIRDSDYMKDNFEIYIIPNISLFPVAPNLEHRASVKRFVSLQFLNPKTVGRMGDQPVVRPLPMQTQNKHRQTSMPSVEFEPTIPAFERAKTVYALDPAATVIVIPNIILRILFQKAM
jgi:hypothetical protein